MATLSHSPSPRTPALRCAFAFAVLIVLLLVANVQRADAIVTKIGSGADAITVGLQPRNAETVYEGGPGEMTFENASGNPVMHSTNTYAIYWDPTDHYHGDWQNLIDNFLQSVGAESGSLSNVFAADTQYLDKTNHAAPYSSTFRGAYTDTDKYPTATCIDPGRLEPQDAITCLTDEQIRTELQQFIAQHGLQAGMSSIFYLLTPPGVTVCFGKGGMAGECSESEAAPSPSYANSFCSYHAAIDPTAEDADTVIYAVIPWTAGGEGDYHLAPADQTPAYDCQDGGFDPTSEPIEQQEKAKKKTTKEEEAEKEETPEEQKERQETETLEGPHEQEPNQLASGRSPDGTYDAGLADLIIGQIANEQQDTVTNPLLNAWQDDEHLELTDECRNFFASGKLGGSVTANKDTRAGTLYNQTLNGNNYYLNNAFNLAALELPYPGIPCVGGVSLLPEFTAPNTVNSGEIVGFDGMESDITLDAGTAFTASGAPKPVYATYTWNFGDDTPTVSGLAPGAPSANSPEDSPCVEPWEAPCAASTFHSYQYGGTYTVTLTVTDIGGNTASITHKLTVVGPPPPSPAPSAVSPAGPASTPASAPSGSSSSSGKSGTTPSASTLPPPAITASVLSKGLKKVTGKGLAVNYTVNEQVAGSLQVLLESSVAKRLGISGPVATSLPAGSPRSIVIGTAVLVTTKGGKGTIHIKFSSRTAKRLGAMHKVKLTLRLIARNASRQSPQSTTLLSTVVLDG